MRRVRSTDWHRFTETHVYRGSLKISAQHEKLKSEIWTYFDQVNPVKGISLDNLKGVSALVDTNSEANYGSPLLKVIASRSASHGRSSSLKSSASEGRLARSTCRKPTNGSRPADVSAATQSCRTRASRKLSKQLTRSRGGRALRVAKAKASRGGLRAGVYAPKQR